MTDKFSKTFQPKSRADWRAWLRRNHKKEDSVWLIYKKAKQGLSPISYPDAVEEALCFGWIDSTAKSIDDVYYKQYFAKRKAKSVWSKVNKAKVERLIEQKRMTQAGYDIIETAKLNGSWTILDEAEALTIPADLEKEFLKRRSARQYFLSLSRSAKRNILQWLTLAKRAETRQKRIIEIVQSAGQKQQPKPFR